MNHLPLAVWADERGLVAELEGLGPGVTVVRHCADLAEVLAAIGSGLARACVLAGPSPDVDRAFAEGLERVGGRGVVLCDDPLERSRLRRLGLTVTETLAPAGAVVAALGGRPQAPEGQGAPDAAAPAPAAPDAAGSGARAASGRGGPGSDDAGGPTPGGAGAGSPRGVGQADRAAPGAWRGQAPARDPQGPGGRRQGSITVVWGTAGAPGRTGLALNLAVETALAGASVALVDADTHAASLACQLGLLDETAGLVRLCRAVEEGGFDPRADTAAFARVRAAGAELRVTSGLPRPERWEEVSGPALRRALRALAEHVDAVIVDVAAPVGRDDELLLDSFAPQRNEATLAAIAVADRLLALGTADPVGLPRLVRACEEAAVLPAGPVPEVVVNKLRASVSGPRPEAAVRLAWQRFGPPALVPALMLPWDPVAADAALLAGRSLAEAAPRSALRRAVAQLVRLPPWREPNAGPDTRTPTGRRSRRRPASGDRLGDALPQ